MEAVLQRLRPLAAALDPGAQLGFHVCYDDGRCVHFVQPKDLGLVVAVANGIMEELSSVHEVAYVHLPVPKDRADEACFEPLRVLPVGKEKEDGHGPKLFLGLVHAGDEEGTRKRMEAASKIYGRRFEVATECGLGRTPVEEVPEIFDLLRKVIDGKE